MYERKRRRNNINTMSIVFVFKDGRNFRVDNIQDEFQEFSKNNCASQWAVFRDVTINMQDVSYFYVNKEKITPAQVAASFEK